MLRAPLLWWFSWERGVYCLRVLFWRQAKASEFSTSQKWPPRDHSLQCLMGNTGSLSFLSFSFLLLWDMECNVHIKISNGANTEMNYFKSAINRTSYPKSWIWWPILFFLLFSIPVLKFVVFKERVLLPSSTHFSQYISKPNVLYTFRALLSTGISLQSRLHFLSLFSFHWYVVQFRTKSSLLYLTSPAY